MFQGAFTNYVCIQGWVGGQQNTKFTTVKVQIRVCTWSKNANVICESSLINVIMMHYRHEVLITIRNTGQTPSIA